MSAAREMPPLPVTAEEALHFNSDRSWELVAGEIREMSLAGAEHGACGGNLLTEMAVHVRAHGLGKLYLAETGFLIARDPDTVRGPDIAFIRKERVPHPTPLGWMPTMPDLVVEVISPREEIGAVADKIGAWLDAGVPLVWAVYPRWRAVQVHRPGREIRFLTESATLDGEDVLPGFTVQVKEIFE